jgi:hypothetical protein
MRTMGALDGLDDPGIWQDFYDFKAAAGHLSRHDAAALQRLIAERGYLHAARALQAGSELPAPRKICLNKLGSRRKRIVYAFDDDLMWVLKLLAWLLFRYDGRQPQGCYSFRRNFGVHRALRDMLRVPALGEKWCCRLDISDYFNSIQVPQMLAILSDVLHDDQGLLAFFQQLLGAGTAWENGRLIHEQHGAMAGTPTAPFLANLYLRDLDGWFHERGIAYARYSDDIIFFADDHAALLAHRAAAEGIIASAGLAVNAQKASVAAPGEPWEFLGICYCRGVIDLSAATRKKIKGKIRRKARALRRWMLKRQVEAAAAVSTAAGAAGAAAGAVSAAAGDSTPGVASAAAGAVPIDARAIRAFIRSFNRKFFDQSQSSELSWSRWFFPLLTTSDGLREIDHYLQQYARWIPAGSFGKKNHRVTYRQLKSHGLRSLVNEYHRYRKARASGSSQPSSSASAAAWPMRPTAV